MQPVMLAAEEEQGQQDHLVLQLAKAATEHYGLIPVFTTQVAAVDQLFFQQ